MAAAFWRRSGGEARSAGSQPAHAINPVVMHAMREVGIDLTGNTPRRVTDSDAEWADVVVTMGCGDACPYIPGKRYVDWDLVDPAGKEIAAVRSIRDEVARHVQELAGHLAV